MPLPSDCLTDSKDIEKKTKTYKACLNISLDLKVKSKVNSNLNIAKVKLSLPTTKMKIEALYRPHFISSIKVDPIAGILLRATARNEGISIIHSELCQDVNKKMNMVNALTPEFTTKDLSLITDNIENFIPELPTPIPWNEDTWANIASQDKITIRVIKSKSIKQGTVGERRLWLVALLEYEGIPCLWLLNHLWDNHKAFPDSFVINRKVYIRMAEYILSLFSNGSWDCWSLYPDSLNITKDTYIEECNPEECITVECGEDGQQLVSFNKALDTFIDLYIN